MQLTGTATVTASSFINGIPSTPFIGLTPFSIGPGLSTDYSGTGLQPNDFSGTNGGPNPGVLPAGSIFALIDLDSTENYRQITATNAANAVITTPWINGPTSYFDMNNPMTPMGLMVPVPTLTGPVAGVYQMFGPSANFDVGMWLFNTTQDVKTISFNMELGIGGNPSPGGGGAAWAFYTKVPEPTAGVLICSGALAACGFWRSRRRC
jgi:hypothetical protein